MNAAQRRRDQCVGVVAQAVVGAADGDRLAYAARATRLTRLLASRALACGAACLVVLAAPVPALAAGSPAAGAASDAASGPGAANSEITPAEQMMFTTDHLHGIAAQTELDYRFGHTGEAAERADTVRVLVTSADNAKGDAQVSDHTGPVRMSNEGLPCNPVILYFLERDIARMEQATGGQRRYFQKRVRLALAAGPPITPVTHEVNGKRVQARQIVIQPYLHDPNAQRFEHFVGKRYTFVFADSVPGKVLLIRTDVPGPNDDFSRPAQVDSLSFDAVLLGGKGNHGTAPRASR